MNDQGELFPGVVDDRLPHQRSALESPAAITAGIHHREPRDTERAAADRATPRTGTARARVLAAIGEAPHNGATDEELQRHLKLNPNTERPRRVELERGGYIFDSGKRRPTVSGDSAIVWKVTPAGALWCERYRRGLT